jgi:hypothetical protein
MESIHPFHYFGYYKINIFCKSVMNLAGRKNVLGGPRVGHPWSRQSAHRLRLGSEPYAPVALYSPQTLFLCFWYSFLLQAE